MEKGTGRTGRTFYWVSGRFPLISIGRWRSRTAKCRNEVVQSAPRTTIRTVAQKLRIDESHSDLDRHVSS